MQVISKFEQPSSPSSSLTSPSPSSPLSPKYLKDLIEEITKVLENGQESAHHIKSLVDERLGLKIDDHHADLDHHFGVTLNSYEIALSLLKSCDFDQENFMRKRKINGLNNIIECPDLCKSEENGGRILSKEKRGCYKRRRTGQSWSVEATNLVDDGHAWRKYGQKEILNTKFPRNYYRCTHKHDQKCQATKQVQQISENPTKYNIIYHGNHTCRNLHKTPSITIDCQEEKSSIYLSFDTNNSPTDKQHKHGLNASLFPSSAFHTSPAMLKQDYTSIKEESSSPSPMPHDFDHHAEPSHNLQLPSSSCSDNQLPCSSDLTSTPLSDQGDDISPHEIYSSAPNLFDMLDADDLINLINLDHCDRLDGMFQNLYQQQDHQT